MSGFGLSAEDLDIEIDVYPENWPAFVCFTSLQTQWHMGGMGGRTGLMYSAAYQWMDEQGIKKRSKRQDLMQCLRVMEIEALNVWSEKKD